MPRRNPAGGHNGRRSSLTVVIAVALPLLLYFGRERWFRYDEWSFLASREVNLHDLFTAHSVHWVTLPILVYRALWAAFGLHSYVPYQAVSVVSRSRWPFSSAP